MTIYLLADFHGRSISDFLSEESPGNNDAVVSLGDVETTQVIHELKNLEEDLAEERFTAVGGNHDQALLEEQGLNSRSYKPAHEIKRDLNSDDVARSWLEEVLSEPYREFKVGERQSVAVHGGLDGYLRHPEMDEEIRHLWYRLWYESDSRENFRIMEQKNWHLMARGHDHDPEIVEKKASGDINFSYPENRDLYTLDSDCLYIITPGAWMNGNYAAIDEKRMEVEFRNFET